MAIMKIKGKALTATEFKAKCLRILDDLEPQGIIILKRGRPVAKLTPLSHRKNEELIGLMKGKIVIKGDIFSTGVRWNAQP
jgi:antitoxin (DNA-binding transcriptional repressor) of toxin-antitoxin stability system